MKIELWQIGKTNFPYLQEGISLYEKRLKHYLSFEIITLNDIKNAQNLRHEQIKTAEGALILNKLNSDDYLILLDEKGKMYDSVEFASYLDKIFLQTPKKVVILVGGAYGFSETVYERAQAKVSLSKMTFSHQMVRLFVVEQLYRAMTILRNEPYHHQ